MFVITLLFPVYLVYGLLAFKAEQSPPKKAMKVAFVIIAYTILCMPREM